MNESEAVGMQLVKAMGRDLDLVQGVVWARGLGNVREGWPLQRLWVENCLRSSRVLLNS